MKNADLPAMPTKGVISDTDEVWAFQTGSNAEFQFVGLTKREMFAMHFMQAWIQHHGSAGDYGFSKEGATSLIDIVDKLNQTENEDLSVDTKDKK